MLLPRKTKFRKQQRGRRAGFSKGQQRVHFGDYGLKALETGWITNRQIEAARIAMTRKIKRGGKVWINVFPDKPVTQKPLETRMGSGKGSPEHWVAVVKPRPRHVRALRRAGAACEGGDAPRRAEAADQDEVREAGGRAVRTRELRELSDDDLAKRLAEQREELFNLRFQDATGALENTASPEADEAGDRTHPDAPERAGHEPGEKVDGTSEKRA